MTARTAWRQAWRQACQAVIDDEPPDIGSAYAWCAWLLVWSRERGRLRCALERDQCRAMESRQHQARRMMVAAAILGLVLMHAAWFIRF